MIIQLLDPNIIIPIIIGLHVLGIILTYIITFYHVKASSSIPCFSLRPAVLSAKVGN
jgi:hypothetical protein